MDAIKAALGVRRTTQNDAVLIESGMPCLKDLIIERTKRFVKKRLIDEKDEKTPLYKVCLLCEENSTKGYRFLKTCLRTGLGGLFWMISRPDMESA